MITTITHARAHLGQLWDKAERTGKPITITRRGHQNMVLMSAAALEGLQDTVIAPFLAQLGVDIDKHPERLRGFPPKLLARIRRLSTGITVDHGADIEGVADLNPKLYERMLTDAAETGKRAYRKDRYGKARRQRNAK